MYCCSAASLAAFLCPQDFPFVLIIRGALKNLGCTYASNIDFNLTDLAVTVLACAKTAPPKTQVKSALCGVVVLLT